MNKLLWRVRWLWRRIFGWYSVEDPQTEALVVQRVLALQEDGFELEIETTDHGDTFYVVTCPYSGNTAKCGSVREARNEVYRQLDEDGREY